MLENLLNPADLSIFKTNFDAVGVEGRICKKVLYNSPCKLSTALILFKYDIHLNTWFDIISLLSIHMTDNILLSKVFP